MFSFSNFCPFFFLSANKLTKGGRPQTQKGDGIKTSTRQEVHLICSIYPETMLKICWNSKDFIFPLRKKGRKQKISSKNHKMQKFDMKFHKWREAPDQRKPPLILIIAGWAPELIIKRHTVLGARAPAQLQPGCARFSPILEEKLIFF